jgi:hypothetical protein
MILECRHCHQKFDSADLPPGTAVGCTCGDVLVVPSLHDREGTEMIDGYLKRYGEEIGLDFSALKDGDGWSFMAGSAEIQVVYDAGAETITMDSTILSLPESFTEEASLFRTLLELNHTATGEARFALVGRDVVVTFSRSTLGLDYEEFRSAIDSVCRTADDYDDELRDRFVAAAGGDDAQIQLTDADAVE